MSETASFDAIALTRWLRDVHPELVGEGNLVGTRLEGGLSNLTYRLDGGPRPIVLRRPPLGHVLPTAHDMVREFRVISGLAASPVPVPRVILFKNDSDTKAGVGTAFYLMEFVDGLVLSHPSANRAFSAEQLKNLSFELVETLAGLHDADASSLGLAELGHAEGFLARQLRRWATQYGQSVNREQPELEQLQNELIAHIPVTHFTSLIHGDYRLDNAIVHTAADGNPSIAAILDWEMATIGDSITDLGLLGLYWEIRTISPGSEISMNSAIDPAAGYPSFPELVARYATVREIEIGNIGWYIAFAAYKLAVILEGIHYRYSLGKTVGAGFAEVGESVAPLARYGLAALSEHASVGAARRGK